MRKDAFTHVCRLFRHFFVAVYEIKKLCNELLIFELIKGNFLDELKMSRIYTVQYLVNRYILRCLIFLSVQINAKLGFFYADGKTWTWNFVFKKNKMCSTLIRHLRLRVAK